MTNRVALDFAKGLATELNALGWGNVSAESYPDMRDGARVIIPDSGYVMRVTIGAGRGEVRAFVPAGNDCEAAGLDYRERSVLGETTFDVDRTPKQVVKQVVRRIVSPAVAPIAKMRELIASRASHADKLAGTVQAWRHLYPTARIEISADKSRAIVHMSRTVQDGSEHGDYRYIDGELFADGSFYVSRTSRFPAAAATALLGSLFQ